MISIKDLSEISFVKTIIVIMFLSLTIFPPFIYVYNIDRDLFINLDFWKLFILTTGFGLITTSISFLIGIILMMSTSERVLNSDDFAPGITATALSIILMVNFLFSINLSIPNSIWLLSITSIAGGIKIYWTIFVLSTLIWIGFVNFVILKDPK